MFTSKEKNNLNAYSVIPDQMPFFLHLIWHFTDCQYTHSGVYQLKMVYAFHANGNFRHLLITFANNMDPDQDRQNYGPDPDPKHLTS